MKIITIGRSSDNDVVVNDAKVSRVHLQLVRSDSGICSVVDLGSANGTFVNGQRIVGEVRLQSHDVVRIGNTILPWQEYIEPVSVSKPEPTDIAPIPPVHKTHKVWLYIAVCAVFVVSAGIGVYLYCNRQEQPETEASAGRAEVETSKEQPHRDAEQISADDLYIQMLESQNEERGKRIADKEKEVRDAKSEAEAAQKNAEQLGKAKDEAEANAANAAEAAEKAKKEASAKEEEVKTANKAKQEAVEQANQAIKDREESERAQQQAQETARLTKIFYEEYAEMNNGLAKAVCEQLNVSGDNKPKAALKDRFNSVDNAGKQKIVDAIAIQKQQQNRRAKKADDATIKPDTVKSANEAAVNDDKIAVKNDE